MRDPIVIAMLGKMTNNSTASITKVLSPESFFEMVSIQIKTVPTCRGH